MNADNEQTLEHLVQLACSSVHAERAELIIGDEPALRIAVPASDDARRIEAPDGFFDVPRFGNVADLDQLGDTTYGAIVSVPITGPSAEAGWLVAVHPEPNGLAADSPTLLQSAVALIEAHLDRGVERIRLDQLSEVLRNNQTALQLAQTRLEMSNSELEQFAYIAAHELLSPLRSVVVYAELLDSNLGGLDAEQMHACAKEIRQGVSLMDQQLQHLLELSSTQQDAADPVPVDLDVIVRDALDALERVLDDAHATVQVGTLPIVSGRPVLLQSVFSNLITNAVKYHAPGREPIISISAEQDDAGTKIHVEDNGQGITPENQERVFALFERASTDTPGSGIGLGLSRRIVEAFGGSIAYREADEGGSIFTISFPPLIDAA